jgi:hypothetical protein
LLEPKKSNKGTQLEPVNSSFCRSVFSSSTAKKKKKKKRRRGKKGPNKRDGKMPAKCGTVDYRTKIYLVHAGLFISVKILCPVLVVHEYLESTETIGFSPRDLGLKMLHSFTRS